jgi:hypothetical protein
MSKQKYTLVDKRFGSVSAVVYPDENHVHIMGRDSSIAGDADSLYKTTNGVEFRSPQMRVMAKVRMPDHVARWLLVRVAHHCSEKVVDSYKQGWTK